MGWGVNRAPQHWGGGVWEKGSVDRTIQDQLLRTLAPKFFLSIQNGQFFSPNTWQMMTFLNPLNALIPKIPFSFFADFWVWVTSEARGSVLVGFWGSRQLSPFWGGGGGGSSQGDLSTPLPSN